MYLTSKGTQPAAVTPITCINAGCWNSWVSDCNGSCTGTCKGTCTSACGGGCLAACGDAC